MSETLKCPHCGATETKSGPFKNKSSLNTHINIHCPQKPVADADNQNDSHVHKWALLNPNYSAAHGRAIQEGYSKVCKCGEVV